MDKQVAVEMYRRKDPDAIGNDNAAFTDLDQIDPKADGMNDGMTDDEKYSELDGYNDEEEPTGALAKGLAKIRYRWREWRTDNAQSIRSTVLLVLLGLALAYVIYCLHRDFKRATALFVFLCIGLAGGILTIFTRYAWPGIKKNLSCASRRGLAKKFHILKWVVFVITWLVLLIYFGIIDNIDREYNMKSLAGYFVFLFVIFLFSTNPLRVGVQTVIGGLLLEISLGLIVLRTSWGFTAFSWLGEQIQTFLAYTNAGSSLVFGEKFLDHPFAFQVMPIVIFFSAFISMLYYLGVMQIVISAVARVMQVVMNTTAGESLNAAGNIFVGMTEAPLMIKPIINDLTLSELHAVITGGFATIAGSVMASYIAFGVPANHLISASVMAAPCALALSKLSYPETQRSRTTANAVSTLEKGDELNFIQAFSNGATSAIGLVANIIVNLIAFMAALTFVNAVLSWAGALAGLEPPDYPPFTFQFICSYLLWPVAFLMGVDTEFCRQVATLLGIKLMLNEFVAYTDLSKYIGNRVKFEEYMLSTNYSGNYTKVPGPYFDNYILTGTNETLENGFINERSEVIATYALCGFANLSSIGIVLGGLGAIAPHRKNDVARLVVRAMIIGNLVSWVNASVAGMLYTGDTA